MSRPPQPAARKRVACFCAFALLYALSTFLGRMTVLPGHELALFWPAAGVGVWWALVTRGRALGLLVVVVWTTSLLGNAATGTSLLTAGLFGAANVGTVLGTRLIATAVVRRGRQDAPDADDAAAAGSPAVVAGQVGTVADLLRIFAAAAVAATLGGTAGLLGLVVAGADPTPLSLFMWSMRHLAAVVVIALPALAVSTWLSGPRVRPDPAWGEALCLLLVTALVQWLVFAPGQTLPLVFVPFVLLFWSGTRMPLPLAGLHGVLMAFSALALVQAGGGGVLRLIADPGDQALTLQAFMMLATGLALLVSAAMTERESLARTLAASGRRARRQAHRLEEAKARAERLLSDAPHGVAVLGLDGRIQQSNTALAAMTGMSPEDLTGVFLPDLSPRHAQVVLGHLEEAWLTPGSLVSADWTIEREDRRVHVALSSRLLDAHHGEDAALLVHVVDVSERRHYEQRLAHLADHDVLTGLFNRRRFDEAMHQHLDLCARYGYRGAMLLLDLDQFKEVNDSQGHAVGDQLLVSVALILSGSMRAGDLVARLGGDEFAVLLPGADRAGAETVAANLVERVRRHAATLDGVARRVTTSIGVITFAGAHEHDQDPMVLADMLLYDAKDNGRDQYAVLDDETFRVPRSGARLAWRNRMERALERDEGFELYLQPIVDVRSNRVVSAEALLRLVDRGEPVPAAHFFYVAERTGMAPRVDAWVVRQAVAVLSRLREVDPGFQLEVNLSGHSIGDPAIETAIVESLARHSVDPGALILEITETAAVADLPTARSFGERITAIGARFALDDFGAGFGSFYYLKHLVFDYLKIDGEFVAHSSGSRLDRMILGSIVGIARDLDKRTVAEFVGDEETMAVVREQGIDLAQGHLIGRAVPEAEFVATHLTRRRVGPRAHDVRPPVEEVPA